MRPLRLAAAASLLGVLTACATSPPAASGAGAGGSLVPAPSPSATVVPISAPDLVPPAGQAWFGMNLDWGNDSVAGVGERLGATPAAWVQFVRFPLDDVGRGHLAGFFEQVGAARGIGVVTLEPHDGLEAVTPAASEELATLLDDAARMHGVPTLVRFAHEMNGSWYAWGQRPDAYVAAFRIVADAIHAGAPASAMAWAPNDGSGYPFLGGPHGAVAGSAEAAALDTDRDGALTRLDDPYAPYWPGHDAVDWVGMSLYFWGLAYPWGENEVAPPGRFAAQLRGEPTGAHADEVAVPDFYATYAEGHDKPMAIFETAALWDPAGGGPGEAEVKGAWFGQVFSHATRDAFPRLAMLNWFEWRKEEAEVGAVIDWRLAGDPALGRALLDSAPGGWLRLAGD